MPLAPTTASVQPNDPDPHQDRLATGTDAPSRTGRLLGLVRTLIDRGKQLATTLRQRTATTDLSNIIRHSRATAATISLAAEDGALVLTVTDNGRGFDTAARKSGIGLRAINENAASLGGNSSIMSSPDGTRIVVSLPIAAD